MSAEDTYLSLAPILTRLRDSMLCIAHLESLPPDRLRNAVDLAKSHLLQECGYCLDERNRSPRIRDWTLDYMREVVLAEETLDRIANGKYVVRVTEVTIKDPALVHSAQRRIAASPELPMECLEPEEADALS